jgi:hypothetical protein
MNLMQRWLNNFLLKPLQGSWQRFPVTLIYSFLLGFLMVLNEDLELNWLTDVSQALFIFLPLTLSVTLIRETFAWWRWSKIIDILTVILLTGLYFGWLQLEANLAVGFFRFSNLLFGFYLLPLFIRYFHANKAIEKPIIDGINVIFTALVYALFLFVGVAIILLSTNILFNLSIAFTVYSNVLILSLTYVFVPTWLNGFPRGNEKIEEGPYSVIWERIFLFVLAPVISVFMIFIVIYLLTGLFQSEQYNAGIYTLSTLVIAFAGISTHVSTRRFVERYPLIKLFQNLFPIVLLVIMFGYYVELIRVGIVFGFSMGIVLQLMMGIWPISYAIWVLKKHPQATQRALLTLVGIYVFAAVMPFVNGVGIARFILQGQFNAAIERLDMLDEEGELMVKNDLTQEEYNQLFSIVTSMNEIGLASFSGIPESYEHPFDFPTTFGTYTDDPVVEFVDYYFSLSNQILDFSSFDYETFLFVPSIMDLVETPYTSDNVAMSLTMEEETDLQLDWNITYGEESISISILEEMIAVLLERHFPDEDIQQADYTAVDPEDLLISFTFETFSMDIWVQSLIYFDGYYRNFAMGAYVGFFR